jgi:hypothetical protein
VAEEEGRQNLAVRGFSFGESFFFGREVVALVDESGSAGAVDFKWAEK